MNPIGTSFRMCWRLLCAALTLVLLAACGAAATPTPPPPTATPTATARPAAVATATPTVVAPTATAAPPDWKRTAAVEVLYEAAKKEGSVTVYATGEDLANAYKAAFEREFPGITVDIRALAPAVRASSYVTERRAGRRVMDVIDGSLRDVDPVIRNDFALLGTDWKALGVTDDHIATKNGSAIAARRASYCNCFNSRLVNAADLPTNLEGYRDPKWKGKLVASDFLFPAGMGYYAMATSIEKAVDLGNFLVKTQDMVVTPQQTQLVVSGERPVGFLGFGTGFITEARKGVPIGFSFADDLGIPVFVFVVANDAPHPNAAILFAAFSSSSKASKSAWESPGATGWPAYGHGPAELLAAQFGGRRLIYEDESNFIRRSDLAAEFNRQVLGAR